MMEMDRICDIEESPETIELYFTTRPQSPSAVPRTHYKNPCCRLSGGVARKTRSQGKLSPRWANCLAASVSSSLSELSTGDATDRLKGSRATDAFSPSNKVTEREKGT